MNALQDKLEISRIAKFSGGSSILPKKHQQTMKKFVMDYVIGYFGIQLYIGNKTFINESRLDKSVMVKKIEHYQERTCFCIQMFHTPIDFMSDQRYLNSSGTHPLIHCKCIYCPKYFFYSVQSHMRNRLDSSQHDCCIYP